MCRQFSPLNLGCKSTANLANSKSDEAGCGRHHSRFRKTREKQTDQCQERPWKYRAGTDRKVTGVCRSIGPWEGELDATSRGTIQTIGTVVRFTFSALRFAQLSLPFSPAELT
jgi:hypothetical protein